jgi:hypothetical protein
VLGKCQANKRPAVNSSGPGNYAVTLTKISPGLRKGVAVQPIRVTGIVKAHIAMYRSTALRQASVRLTNPLLVHREVFYVNVEVVVDAKADNSLRA